MIPIQQDRTEAGGDRRIGRQRGDFLGRQARKDRQRVVVERGVVTGVVAKTRGGGRLPVTGGKAVRGRRWTFTGACSASRSWVVGWC